jgi:hypothetical protein
MNVNAFNSLCKTLDIPGELTERLTGHFQSFDFDIFKPWIDGLFSLETGGESVKRISELCKTTEDPDGDRGLKALTVYLTAALRTKEMYNGMGIDESIFIDTIKALPRFAYEHMESYGCYGFDRHFWIYRQLAARLFRLGTLEFELYRLPDKTAPAGLLAPGENTLSVHIPSDAVMSREALDNSYRMAAAFMARFFPDFHYRCFYCSTWLLSPKLKEILKPGSRILLFQEDYTLTETDMEVNGGLKWVFKRDYEDFSQLPEDTSLMRGMKNILLAGEKTGSAAGFIPAERFQ